MSQFHGRRTAEANGEPKLKNKRTKKNRCKIPLIVAVVTANLLVYWHFSQPKESEEMFTGEFGSGQFRNTETKNLSPYAIFGDSSFVLMTEEERTGKHFLEILTNCGTCAIKKIHFDTRTGHVFLIGEEDKILSHITSTPDMLARFLSTDPKSSKYPAPAAHSASTPSISHSWFYAQADQAFTLPFGLFPVMPLAVTA